MKLHGTYATDLNKLENIYLKSAAKGQIKSVRCGLTDWRFGKKMRNLNMFIIEDRGPGSVVGIATGYVLDGPGIKSRGGGGRDFPHLSRPALRPTQPPV